MNQNLFSNNASTTLAVSITPGSTSLSVTGGAGSLFPSISSGQQFIFTLQHIVAGAVSAYEICVCTSRSGDNFATILRGQEGTAAQSWSAGDVVTLLPTAGGMDSFIQIGQLQSQSTNYAIDLGFPNVYVVTLTPALTASVVGMPIRWKASNSNTGPSTFFDGVTGASLTDQRGAGLVPGMIVAGSIYTTVWTGLNFHLTNPTVQNFNQLSGQLAAPQMSAAAISATLSNAALTGVPTAPTASIGSSSSQVATTQFANPGQSAATNGYVKLPGGIVFQWGYVQTGASSGGPVDITFNFPIAFSVSCVAVMVSTNRNVSSSGQAINGSNFSSNYSRVGCTVTVDNIPGGVAGGHWFAVGF